MPQSTIPQDVIDRDHALEGRSEKATEALAKHRWHQTLDPKGPQHGAREYAKAIGRSQPVVRTHAKGYEMWLERQADSERPGLSLEDCFRLAGQSAENQAFSEAIAEGSGEPVGRVARGDNATKRGAIIEQARQRADRRGTDPVDEAREIARRGRQAREIARRHQTERRESRSVRFVRAEGRLANAKRQILNALSEVEGVEWEAEERALLLATVANLTAVLNLLDRRIAGTEDVDFDVELARILAEDAS